MNNITVAGVLGKDAEIRHMPNGDPVASFSVADSQGRDKPTIWWMCQLFGKRAETLSQYLLKGGAVTVSGNVSEREWTDKDGQKRKSMDIRVNDVALQGGRKEQAQSSYAPPSSARAPAQQAQHPAGGGGFEDMDSDIPF
jgi:single-strand DNA-binding protein